MYVCSESTTITVLLHYNVHYGLDASMVLGKCYGEGDLESYSGNMDLAVEVSTSVPP